MAAMAARAHQQLAFERGSWSVPGMQGAVGVGYERWTPRRPHALGAHVHRDHWEIHYLVHGQIAEEIAGATHVMTSGDILIAPPGVVHSGINRVRHRCGLCWLGVRLSRALPGFTAGEMRRVRRAFQDSGSAPFPADPALLPAFWGLLRACAAPGARQVALCRAYVVLILHLATRTASCARREPALRSPAVARAVALLSERLDFPLRIASLSAAVGLGRSALTERFVAEMGVTPVAFRMQRRLESATRMLPGATIAQVARRLGFASPQYFANCFRRAYGLSPAAWLRSMRPPSPNEPG